MNFGVQESLRTFLYPFFHGKGYPFRHGCRRATFPKGTASAVAGSFAALQKGAPLGELSPQVTEGVMNNKKRLCRSRAVKVHTEKISAWRTGVHRWQGCALHAMLEQRSISASGSPLAGQPPEMRSRAPQFSGKAGSKKTALPKQSRKSAY